MVMRYISGKTSVEALSGLTKTSAGAVSEYNGAIVKRHSSCTSDILYLNDDLTLSNVTLDGGAVWDKSDDIIDSNSNALVERTNNGISASSYLVYATSNIVVTLQDVTIQNCDNVSTTSNGAAIYFSTGNLSLVDCTIKDCVSRNGAVFIVQDSTFNATNSSFCYNYANGTGTIGNGGAINLSNGTSTGSAAVFDGCTFKMNAAKNSGGAVFVGKSRSATFKNMSSALITGNFSDAAKEPDSRVPKGNFVYSSGSITLEGSFNFSSDIDFYIDNYNVTPGKPILLANGFTNTSSNKAQLHLYKSFEESIGETVLALADATDTSVNITTAKEFFKLEGENASDYKISDEGKIQSASGG